MNMGIIPIKLGKVADLKDVSLDAIVRTPVTFGGLGEPIGFIESVRVVGDCVEADVEIEDPEVELFLKVEPDRITVTVDKED